MNPLEEFSTLTVVYLGICPVAAVLTRYPSARGCCRISSLSPGTSWPYLGGEGVNLSVILMLVESWTFPSNHFNDNLKSRSHIVHFLKVCYLIWCGTLASGDPNSAPFRLLCSSPPFFSFLFFSRVVWLLAWITITCLRGAVKTHFWSDFRTRLSFQECYWTCTVYSTLYTAQQSTIGTGLVCGLLVASVVRVGLLSPTS